MDIEVLDVLKANVVFLDLQLLADSDIESLSQALGTDVLPSGAGVIIGRAGTGQHPSQSFRLDRERITLEVSRIRSTVEQEYPVRDALDRLADLTARAIRLSEVDEDFTTAFGINLDLICEPHSSTPASQYIARRLFSSQFQPPGGWQLDRGAAQIGYVDGPSRWNLTLEPRLKDNDTTRVFLSVNHHLENQPLPDRAKLTRLLEHTWDQSHEFVQRMHETPD